MTPAQAKSEFKAYMAIFESLEQPKVEPKSEVTTVETANGRYITNKKRGHTYFIPKR